MSQGQLETTETLLEAIDECAMSLLFSDHSTQLRQGKVRYNTAVMVRHPNITLYSLKYKAGKCIFILFTTNYI